MLTIDQKRTLVQDLLSKHGLQIERFLKDRSGRKVLQRTTVEDLFQETAAAAVSSADSFEFLGEEKFLAWMKTIARRTIARSSAPAGLSSPFVRICSSPSSGPGVNESGICARGRTPSSMAALDEQTLRLRRGLDQLPEQYRKVLVLYKIEERTLAEVATELHRTKGATCRLIARATEALRRSLSP